MLSSFGERFARASRTRGPLFQMHKLDSVFHESQPLNSVLTIGPLRIFSAKMGVTTPSGVFTPNGYQVRIPAFENHIDNYQYLRT